MIEVCLKIPPISVFIEGDLKDNSIKKKMSELFCNPDINVLMAEQLTIKLSESAPYDLDFKSMERNGLVLIPTSNISCMKNIKEG